MISARRRRIHGVDCRPCICGWIVFSARVYWVLKKGCVVAAPNDHFRPGPHRRVFNAPGGRIHSAGWSPTIIQTSWRNRSWYGCWRGCRTESCWRWRRCRTWSWSRSRTGYWYFERADINRAVGDAAEAGAALVGCQTITVLVHGQSVAASIDRRTARQEGVSLCRSAVVCKGSKAGADVRYVVCGSAGETRARSIADQVVVLRVEGAEQVRATDVSCVTRDDRITDVNEGHAIIDASTIAGSVACHRAVRNRDRGAVVVEDAPTTTARTIDGISAHRAVRDSHRAIVKNTAATDGVAVVAHCAVRYREATAVKNATAAVANHRVIQQRECSASSVEDGETVDGPIPAH